MNILKIFISLAGFVVLFFSFNYSNDGINVDKTKFINGDIIFQVSLSNQSISIQKATKSQYSHCGIIFIKNKDFYVFEAVQPVKITPLEMWIKRGENEHFVVKRLKKHETFLNKNNINKMQQIGKDFIGKNYDLTFEWSDERIYCAELVWKIYYRSTGLKIGKLNKLNDFDLSSPDVKKKLKQRYGDKIPLNQPVISPASIYNSDLLFTVFSN